MRARQASVEAMGAPLDAIAAQEDVRGFFAPRLPHIPGRLLCQTVSSSVKAQPMNRPYAKLYTSIGSNEAPLRACGKPVALLMQASTSDRRYLMVASRLPLRHCWTNIEISL